MGHCTHKRKRTYSQRICFFEFYWHGEGSTGKCDSENVDLLYCCVDMYGEEPISTRNQENERELRNCIKIKLQKNSPLGHK